MAVYAIGDIQGCAMSLERLLAALDFSADRDCLWFVGDLVARGPASLAVLRRVRALGRSAITVLGNHDLSLLAAAASGGQARESVGPVLTAADGAELLDWLRHRPLLHHDAALGWTMVHAGLPPQWNVARARACAAEVECALRGEDHARVLAAMYGDEPGQWHEGLGGLERLRYTINALTRLRFVAPDGRLDFTLKGPPGSQPPPWQPWFRIPWRASAGSRILFGHWSALGLLLEADLAGLDTGCVWGGRLTALRLDEPAPPVGVDCPGHGER